MCARVVCARLPKLNCSFEARRLICLKWCLGLMCCCGICLCALISPWLWSFSSFSLNWQTQGSMQTSLLIINKKVVGHINIRLGFSPKQRWWHRDWPMIKFSACNKTGRKANIMFVWWRVSGYDSVIVPTYGQHLLERLILPSVD